MSALYLLLPLLLLMNFPNFAHGIELEILGCIKAYTGKGRRQTLGQRGTEENYVCISLRQLDSLETEFLSRFEKLHGIFSYGILKGNGNKELFVCAVNNRTEMLDSGGFFKR